MLLKYSVNKIEFKEKGLSTLKPRKIWFDETIQRLNVDSRGELLGENSKEMIPCTNYPTKWNLED